MPNPPRHPSVFLDVDVGETIGVLACGPIGPAHKKLLAGRSIKVHQAESYADAKKILRTQDIRACLLRYHFVGGSAPKLLQTYTPKPNAPPMVVLLDEVEWLYTDECLNAGARDVIEINDVDQVVYKLSQLLGLTFGRANRAQLKGKLSMCIDGDWQKFDTYDLRETGVSIRDVPQLEVGQKMKIKLEIFKHTIEVWARVARTWQKQKEAMAGLQFLGLTRVQREWFDTAVGNLRRKKKNRISEPIDEIDAFLDASDGEDPVAQSFWHLEHALLEEGERAEHPRWIYGVIPELTPVERAGAVGGDAPTWVTRAIRVRLVLARYRDDCPVGPPPKRVTDECQRVMDLLAKEEERAHDADLAEQIGLIKSRIIREFLAGSDDGPASERMSTPAFPAAERKLELPMPSPQQRSAQRSAPEKNAVPISPPPPRSKNRKRPSSATEKQPWLGAFARRAFFPLATGLALVTLAAVGAQVLGRAEVAAEVQVIEGADLETAMISEVELSGDLAMATVTAAWNVRDEKQRVEVMQALHKKFEGWNQTVRVIVLHHDEGQVPVAMYDFDNKRLVVLEQPAKPMLTRRAQ